MADTQPTVQGQPTPQAPQANSLHMIATMGIVGFLAGVLLVLTYQVTLPVIEKNKAEALNQAIGRVLPNVADKAAFIKNDAGELVPWDGEKTKAQIYYAAYNESGNLVGVAMEAVGQGFQEPLKLLYGYSPDCECVVGMNVLESKETPGLGDKIMTDEHFKANFEALDVSLNAEKTALENPLQLVKKGEKTEPWQVDSITGATISARAVTDIIRKSAAQHLPIIFDNMSNLKAKPQQN